MRVDFIYKADFQLDLKPWVTRVLTKKTWLQYLFYINPFIWTSKVKSVTPSCQEYAMIVSSPKLINCTQRKHLVSRFLVIVSIEYSRSGRYSPLLKFNSKCSLRMLSFFMVNSEAETEFQSSKWIFQSLFAVNINKNNYPWTYLLTWTEPKYVNPLIGFKSFVLICRVCLFSSQSRVLFLSIGWRLIDLQLSLPMHFNWHWNSSSTDRKSVV